MRQFWKVWRVFSVLVIRTTYLRWALRRTPDEERSRLRARLQMEGCKRLCRVLGIHVELAGRPIPGGGRLVVSNHFGVLDSLILASVLPVSFVAKYELRDWPILGWVASSFGVLFVDRGRRSTVSDFAAQVQERTADGVDVLVFPEGTTSPDLTVLPFKTGAFEAVARGDDKAVLPVYLSVEKVDGQPAIGPIRHRVVWSDSSVPFLEHCWQITALREISMEVRIGEPIPVANRDRKELAQLSRIAVEGLRDRMPAHEELVSREGVPAIAATRKR